MVSWCAYCAEAGKTVGADGGGEVGVCGAGDYDFPVEVFELVGGHDGVNDYFAFAFCYHGRRVLDEGEAVEIFEVKEEVGDGGYVCYVEIDQG